MRKMNFVKTFVPKGQYKKKEERELEDYLETSIN